MFLNPFLEGVILVVLGAGLVALDTFAKSGVLMTSGVAIMGIGIGYFGKSAVEKAQ